MDEIIALRIRPYQESTVIIKALCKNCGLIQIFTNLRNKIEPLSLCKVCLRQKGENFFYLSESTLMDPHLPLRKDLKKLESASFMIKTIEKSQIQARPCKEVFFLFKSYLAMLKILPKNNIAHLSLCLHISFSLKVLEFEGLINKEDLAVRLPTVKNLLDAKKFSTLFSTTITPAQETSLHHLIKKAFTSLT